MNYKQAKQNSRKAMENYIIANSDYYDSVTLSTLTDARIKDLYGSKKDQQRNNF